MIVDSGDELIIIKDGDTVVGKYDGLPVEVPSEFEVEHFSSKDNWLSVEVSDWWLDSETE